VGADKNDLKGTDAGAAFVFYKNKNGINDSWGQNQILLNYNGQAGDRFGSAVGIDDPYAVVASKGDNPFGAGSGRGFVYLLDGSAWIQVDQLADGGGQAGDALGSSAAIGGRNIILGAPFDNNGLSDDQGSVSIYGGLCNENLNPGSDDRDNLNGNFSKTSVRCYPVPFSDVLNIEINGMEANNLSVTIYNSMGQMVTELYHGAIQSDLMLQWQPGQATNGLYYLRLINGEKVVTQTVVRAE
jgi:hypothetical protein